MKKALFGLIILALFTLSCGNISLRYLYGSSVDETFTYFPVDLSVLFMDNDPTEFASYLSGLTDGTLLISPFSRHQSGNHPEGYGKWYIRNRYDSQALAVYAVSKIFLYKDGIVVGDSGQMELATYESHDVYVDTAVDFQVSNNVWLNYDHLDVLKSIKDQVDASENPYIEISAGTLVGYILPLNYQSTVATGSLDFQVSDYRVNQELAQDPSNNMNVWSYPLPYFTEALQTDITNRYAILYATMEAKGRSPESALNNALDINIDNTLWGVWWYESGDLSESSGADYSNYLEIVAFLKHPTKTNAETFKYDPRISSVEVTIPSDLQGIFGLKGGSAPSKYSFLSSFTNWYMFLVSGEANNGIFRIDKNMSTSYYMKVQFVENTDSKWDDQVKFEFFTTSAEASGAFVTPLTYGRNH